jgi:demethylmenaquinone methyltransferase/2-methoxy-6-polyprenyl-1,4-benzoquinol methylase
MTSTPPATNVAQHTMDQQDVLLTAEQNARMFNGLSPHYDRLNRILSLGLDHSWRRRAVALLAPVPAGAYLDIGCGTGDLCVELLRQQPEASVTGIDPAADMLDLARRKLERIQPPNRATFQTGDACALPYPDDQFDGIVSAFCIRNIVDRASAFAEMARVTRAGGRVVTLELTRPRHALLRWGHRVYSRVIVPLAGRLVSQGDAYQYLNDSVAQFPSPELLANEMRAAGLDKVDIFPLTGGTVTIIVANSKEGRP